MTSLLHTCVGGNIEMWQVERSLAITGSTLPLVSRLSIFESHQTTLPEGSTCKLRGATSYGRCVHQRERFALVAQQAEMNRYKATKAEAGSRVS